MQPNSMQQATIIVPADVAAVGIKLIPATHADAAAHMAEIGGQEAGMIQGLLPYGVLLVNGSQRTLLAAGVGIDWIDAQGQRGGLYHMLTAFDGRAALKPGSAQLFVPQRGINKYFATPPSMRGVLPDGYSAMVSEISSQLVSAKSIKAIVEGVVFDDYTFVGSDRMFQRIQSVEPKIHR